MKKKILIATLGIAVLATLGIGTSLAYLTDKDDATNTFTVGEVIIDLEEPNWNDEEDGKDMVPGTTLYKDPTIKCADDSQASYMRVKMVIRDSKTGEVITDPVRYALILDTIVFDEKGDLVEGEKYGRDTIDALPMVNELFEIPESIRNIGSAQTAPESVYFNYKKIFNATDQVTLFSTIAVPTDFGNMDMALLGSYDIELSAEAIQAEGFEDAKEAFDALPNDVPVAASKITNP